MKDETVIRRGSRLFDVDLDLETRRRPQQLYTQLRQVSQGMSQEGSLLRIEGSGVIVCTRSDVETVLHEPAIFSSDMPAADLKNVRPLIPLQIDPPDHKKFRKVLDPHFGPKRIQQLDEPTARLANRLIDVFAEDDEVDFVPQFSVPFPSRVLLELIGLPLEELPVVLELKNGIVRPHIVVGTPRNHPDAAAHQRSAAAAMYQYLARMLDTAEFETTETLLGRLLNAEIDGERLSRREIIDICFLFLIAGLEDVSAALECCFAHLALHPALRREIVVDPAAIPRVVEELLRWETPVPIISRVVTRDTELNGCPISAGELVSVVIGSANTDENDLADGDEVRWDREVNRHLTFGFGIHRCVGSHLARLLLRAAVREWHSRIPNYRVKPGIELTFLHGGVRSLGTFPMVLGDSI